MLRTWREIEQVRMDEARFKRLWHRRMDVDGTPTFRALEALYCEAHRRYHVGAHIEHCLREFDLAVASGIPNADAVETALWFHDAIYETQGAPLPDNEQQSAEFFLARAEGHGSEKFRSDVYRLIKITDHRQLPMAADEQYVVDIDLSSLGLPWPEFLRNSHDLRIEQCDVSDEEYYPPLAVFLQSLLHRPVLYHTSFFHSRYEHSARENLARYLSMEAPLESLKPITPSV